MVATDTLACFILVLTAGIIIFYNREAGTVMYITGMTAAALSLFAFHHLMELLPQTFHALWNRKIIAYRTPKNQLKLICPVWKINMRNILINSEV
jgi:hypothetical protein